MSDLVRLLGFPDHRADVATIQSCRLGRRLHHVSTGGQSQGRIGTLGVMRRRRLLLHKHSIIRRIIFGIASLFVGALVVGVFPVFVASLGLAVGGFWRGRDLQVDDIDLALLRKLFLLVVLFA